MAIDRIDTDEIIQEILDITGYTASTTAPWATDARLIIKINIAAHRIPGKLRQVALAEGRSGRMGMPMWFTTSDSTVSAGVANFVSAADSSTGLLPTDFDMAISLYDLTENRFIDVVDSASERWYRDLREAPAGPTKAMHIQDFNQGAQRAFRLLPDVTGTPSMRLEYFRLPTDQASGAASFPDADFKYHYLWVLETILDILRPDSPDYDRYLALEKEMLLEMATHLRYV